MRWYQCLAQNWKKAGTLTKVSVVVGAVAGLFFSPVSRFVIGVDAQYLTSVVGVIIALFLSGAFSGTDVKDEIRRNTSRTSPGGVPYRDTEGLHVPRMWEPAFVATVILGFAIIGIPWIIGKVV